MQALLASRVWLAAPGAAARAALPTQTPLSRCGVLFCAVHCEFLFLHVWPALKHSHALIQMRELSTAFNRNPASLHFMRTRNAHQV